MGPEGVVEAWVPAPVGADNVVGGGDGGEEEEDHGGGEVEDGSG